MLKMIYRLSEEHKLISVIKSHYVPHFCSHQNEPQKMEKEDNCDIPPPPHPTTPNTPRGQEIEINVHTLLAAAQFFMLLPPQPIH